MNLETVLEEIARYYAEYIFPYIAADYRGHPFERFGLAHLIILGLTFLLALLIIFTRQQLNEDDKDALREIMAQILIINELISYLWLYFYQSGETVKIIYGIPIKPIPFSAINFFAWVAAFMLLKKSQKLYEFTYFIGIPVSLYALIFPTAQLYGFPHYRFFYTLITPAIIFLAAIYMTAVEEKTELNSRSALRVFVAANLILALIYVVNRYFGNNYLFLNAKPTDRPFFAALPDYPIYLLYFEGAGIASALILYIPVLVRNRIRMRNLNQDTARIDKFI